MNGNMLEDWKINRPSKYESINDYEKNDSKNNKVAELLEQRIQNNNQRIEYSKREKYNAQCNYGRNDENLFTDNYKDYIESLQFIDRKFLSTPGKSFFVNEKNDDDIHENVARSVYKRLRLRNALLRELEEQARGYLVNDDIKKDYLFLFKGDSNSVGIGSRAYRLAVTDLFVEKAMAYLERRADEYKKMDNKMIKGGQTAFKIGALLACISLVPFDKLTIDAKNLSVFNYSFSVPFIHYDYHSPQAKLTETTITKYHNSEKYETSITKTEYNTVDAWVSFTKSFSALGMVVLAGVSLFRYGKVLLEQAERLLERRHALRQGRLFVHLNDGKLSLEEMEDAFNWNVTGTNAFSQLPTEAQAPWGNVINQIVHKVPELLKNGLEKISKSIK